MNHCSQGGIQFRVLSEESIEAIYLSTLEVLERTGVRVYDAEGLALLEEAGAQISDETLAKIPASAVKVALQTAPERVVLGNRSGQRAMMLEDRRVYYGTGSDCPFVIDPYSGERRRCIYEDVAKAAKIADALPNIDFFMSFGLVSDAPVLTYDRHQFLAMAANTTKPLVVTAVDRRGLADIYEMSCIVVGGEDKFWEAPLFALYAEPSSPLSHTKHAVRKLLFAAEQGIPVIYTPCPIAGGTSPASLAGLLVVAVAECLSGLVMAQKKKPGAAFAMGGVTSIMDMQATILSYGAPELSLASAALSEISQWLRLPMFSTGGCSDSKTLDQQAAVESAISVLMATLSGANLVHDVGYLESGLTGSYEMLVMSDEVIDMVKHIAKGIRVDEEALAVDIIEAVEPHGQFLDNEHTLRHFREEFWFPQLISRSNYEKWVAEGSKSLGQRVNEKVRSLLAEHEPEPLPEDVFRELKNIISRADEMLAE